MLNTGGHDLPSQIVAQIHYRIPPEKSKARLRFTTTAVKPGASTCPTMG